MNARSRLQKGKNGEKIVCERIERAGLGRARREIGSGSGKNKGDIFANIPFLIEHKNQKTIHFLDWVKQAKKQAEIGNSDTNKWCLTIQDPETPQLNPEIYAVIELDEFLNLLKRNQEPKLKEPDRNLKWKLEKLRQCCRDVENEIN